MLCLNQSARLVKLLTCFRPWIWTVILCRRTNEARLRPRFRALRRVTPHHDGVSRGSLLSSSSSSVGRVISGARGFSTPTERRYRPGRVVILGSH